MAENDEEFEDATREMASIERPEQRPELELPVSLALTVIGAGIILVVLGLALVSVPAAIAAAGLALILLGLLGIEG